MSDPTPKYCQPESWSNHEISLDYEHCQPLIFEFRAQWLASKGLTETDFRGDRAVTKSIVDDYFLSRRYKCTCGARDQTQGQIDEHRIAIWESNGKRRDSPEVQSYLKSHTPQVADVLRARTESLG